MEAPRRMRCEAHLAPQTTLGMGCTSRRQSCLALISIDNCTDGDHNFPALPPCLHTRVQSPNEAPEDNQRGAGSPTTVAAHAQREGMGERRRERHGPAAGRGKLPSLVYLGTQRKVHSN